MSGSWDVVDARTLFDHLEEYQEAAVSLRAYGLFDAARQVQGFVDKAQMMRQELEMIGEWLQPILHAVERVEHGDAPPHAMDDAWDFLNGVEP